MAYRINALDELTEGFRRLPGIGPKTAQRLALHLLNVPEQQAKDFADSIIRARQMIHRCPICQNLTDKPVCPVCQDEKRDKSVICVVENPSDVMAVEKTREYKGLYHVLYGLISPMDNIGPADLPLKELVTRLSSGQVKEVIVATDPTVEGDTTALYIAKLLTPIGVSVSRLAFGIPVGGELECTDELTLSKAIENRRTLQC